MWNKTPEPYPEREPGETWWEWRSRCRAEDLRRLLGGDPEWMRKPIPLPPLPDEKPKQSLCQWAFHTPDDGTRLVHMQRYTAMQPQDGSRATRAATELISAHQNRSHE